MEPDSFVQPSIFRSIHKFLVQFFYYLFLNNRAVKIQTLSFLLSSVLVSYSVESNSQLMNLTTWIGGGPDDVFFRSHYLSAF